MKGKISRETIIYCGLAMVLFVLLFAVTFPGRTVDKSGQQPEIVAFGDSVFGLIRDETSVPALLGVETGMTVFNAGFGGTGLAKQQEHHSVGYPKDSLSMAGLIKAIEAGDFGVQQGVYWRESNMEYFPEVLDALEKIDFSKVQVVLLQQGINDYHAGVPIENPEDPYDKYSFLGALRCSVEALRRVNPELRIVLVTPLYTWYESEGMTCEEVDFGGGILADYVDAQLSVAQELGVEIVDVYHDLYPHDTWEDKDMYTWDGIHPNEEGRRRMAKRIAEVLRKDE